VSGPAAAGSVVGTAPQAGAKALPGSPVQLIVSVGPASVPGQTNGSGKWKDKGNHWPGNGNGNGNGDGGD
jgi:hypothetical protein